MLSSSVERPPPEAACQGHVLLVDDDPAVLSLMTRVLRRAGYQVETASEGETAVNLLVAQPFEIIISDIVLPGMDGHQLLRRAREHDLDVPVVLMTGGPTVQSAIDAVEQGALQYLVKPFPMQVLLDLVARALQSHKLARLKREALEFVGDQAGLMEDRVELGGSLDRALSTLWIAYQPIIATKDRSLFAYEALLRCNEPTLAHPLELLNAAQRLGRLQEVGRAVRDTVALDAGACPAPNLFVNLHPLDLMDDTLFTAQAPLSRIAGRVVLEITERAGLDDIADASARIHVLRQMGFRIAIDDLGAGYAGLTSFAHLEPDVVKFDMSLIRGVNNSPKKFRIIQSMTAMFREMNIVVVAEGVELAAERDALLEAGCDQLQGYLFGRPAPGFCAAGW